VHAVHWNIGIDTDIPVWERKQTNLLMMPNKQSPSCLWSLTAISLVQTCNAWWQRYVY